MRLEPVQPVLVLLSSASAPLAFLRSLRSAYERHPHVYWLDEHVIPADDMVGRIQVIERPSRVFGAMRQFLHGWKALGSCRPKLVVVMMQGSVAPVAWAAVLRGVPVLCVDAGAVPPVVVPVRTFLCRMMAKWGVVGGSTSRRPLIADGLEEVAHRIVVSISLERAIQAVFGHTVEWCEAAYDLGGMGNDTGR